MKVVLAGGSGFIGAHLVPRLLARGDEVAVLTRNPAHVHAGRGVQWDGRTQGPWTAEVAAAAAVVNLAGENLGAGRWTAERKRRLTDSRVDATRALVEAIAASPRAQRVLVNASATGIYGDRGDEELDERSAAGEGFLAELTARWEAAARVAEGQARLVLLRFGVVLSADGGALPRMLTPFRLGVGGPVGSGRQWMSWVDLEDVLRAIEWALDDRAVSGVYNVTAPAPVRNGDFAAAVGKVLHRPSLVTVPGVALRVLFGQMAGELLLAGQRVVPSRAVTEGFAFRYPELVGSLRHALKR